MASEGAPDITALLAAWSDGDQEALARLMPVVYPDLRRIAREYLLRRQSGHSLESAALANEAYLKLVRAGSIRCENRAHFFALCSQIIRRLLVDHARSRANVKRGGETIKVPLDEVLVESKSRGVEVLALDSALDNLARLDERKSKLVELRYFGGLSIDEAAEVLGISSKTAGRDWRMAKAWLLDRLSGISSAKKRS